MGQLSEWTNGEAPISVQTKLQKRERTDRESMSQAPKVEQAMPKKLLYFRDEQED